MASERRHFRHTSRAEGLALQERAGGLVIDVSSYSSTHPFLSPFTWAPEIALAVPGLPDQTSRSVEGVWQGLKIVNGRIDPRHFKMRPRKRRGPVEGHRLGSEVLGIVEARKRIYIPTYFEYLERYVDGAVFDEWLDRVTANGEVVTFFDTESNGDIRVDEPLAHSAVLVAYLDLCLWSRIPERMRRPPATGLDEIARLIDDEANRR